MKKRIIVTIVLTTVLALASALFIACGPKTPADPSGSQTEQGGTEQGGTEQGGGSEEQDPSVHTHSMTFRPAVAETADTDGHIAYYECTSCGKYFRDIEGKEELSKDDIKLDACAHASAVLHEGVRATADTDGEIDYYTCETCGGRFFDRACTRRLPDDDLVEAAHGGLQFEQNDDGLSYSVIGVGTCDKTEVAIPRYYCSLPVTRIGDYAFAENTATTHVTTPYTPYSITSVTIPDSVEYIGNYAFCGCMGLTSVMIPDSVTSIGVGAFASCMSLTSVTIGCGVTSIGEHAFEDCYKLVEVFNRSTHITVEKGKSGNGSVGLYALAVYNDTTSQSKIVDKDGYRFYNGDTIYLLGYTGTDKALVLPNDFDGKPYAIYQYAFYGRSDITSVTIGSGVTSIGEAAFYRCMGLRAVHITDLTAWCNIDFSNYDANPLGYARHLYKDGKEIKDLEIPKGVTEIKNYAFEYCGLTIVTIPDSVTSIGDNAFNSCTGITSITIPASVTNIGYCAFAGCVKLVEVLNRSTHITVEKGDYNNGYVGYYALGVYNDATTQSKIVDQDGYLFYPRDTVYLFGYTGTDKALVLPNDFEGKPYAIYDYAFSECSDMTSVMIPDCVTSIGDSAFLNCTGLTAVHITDLAAWCNIDFGDDYANPLYYADHLYKDETEIKDLEIPQGVTEIKAYAFCLCVGLTSVTIPSSVTSIGKKAFEYCTGLTSVTIPESVKSIGERAFGGCRGLAAVHIEDIAAWCNIDFGDSYYGYDIDPLYHVYRLYKDGQELSGALEIPNGVTKIPNYAFYGCEKITSVTIPETVTSIGNRAFDVCTGLTTVNWNAMNYTENRYGSIFGDTLATVNIGENVESIPAYVFRGRTALTTVNWNATNCTSENSYNSPFYGCTQLATVNIGENVESIPAYAFCSCTDLTSVTIGSSVTSIGESAFWNCIKLVEVLNRSTHITVTRHVGDNGYVGYYAIAVYNDTTAQSKIVNKDGYRFYNGDTVYLLGYTGTDKALVLPNDFEGKPYEIYQYAFAYCSDITSVTIGSGVTSIGSGAFSGCDDLTSVTIGSGVVSIESSAFAYCRGLTSITVQQGNSKYHSAGNCLIETASKTLILGCKTSEIPTDGSVTIIGNGAFSDCTGLTSVTIPDSVTSIGQGAFGNCAGLTSVTIGSNVTNIGDRAFSGCNSLTAVHITDIAAWCNIDFGRSYANPLQYAKHLYKDGTEIQDLEIPQGVTEIKNFAFYGCEGLTSVTIPDSVTCIGCEAFRGCTNLQTVTFAGDSKLQSIGDSAFWCCSSLTAITIPASVTSINRDAFRDCTSLRTVTFADPDGWRVHFSDVVDVSASELQDPATAAKYLTDQYCSYYWQKS